MSVPVKICGLTDPGDAQLCHELGAALLGVIFAPGVRCVDPQRARAIREAVPDARLVGVFVDPEPAFVAEIDRRVGLDAVQMHGRESRAVVEAVRALTGLEIIKAVRADEDAADAVAAADRVLFDLSKGDATPGARDRLWAAAASHGPGPPLILAGGLRPQDVSAAVARVRPAALDVASGVESSPGRKDPRLVRRFLEEAHRVAV